MNMVVLSLKKLNTPLFVLLFDNLVVLMHGKIYEPVTI